MQNNSTINKIYSSLLFICILFANLNFISLQNVSSHLEEQQAFNFSYQRDSILQIYILAFQMNTWIPNKGEGNYC
jgi:hypothetical protein